MPAATMSSRGGARRGGPLPPPKEGFADTLVGWFEKNQADLFKYDFLTRPQACDGPSLVKLRTLIDILMSQTETMEFSMTTLRDAMLLTVRRFPGLNKSKFQDQHWASFRAERLLTVAAHFRRLALDEIRFRQACTKCTPEEVQSLKEPPQKRRRSYRPRQQILTNNCFLHLCTHFIFRQL